MCSEFDTGRMSTQLMLLLVFGVHCKWKKCWYVEGVSDGRLLFLFFFFQAEDGIRDYKVTGVQTCALPIWLGAQRPGRLPLRRPADPRWPRRLAALGRARRHDVLSADHRRMLPPRRLARSEIGRASCRERV